MDSSKSRNAFSLITPGVVSEAAVASVSGIADTEKERLNSTPNAAKSIKKQVRLFTTAKKSPPVGYNFA